MKTTRKPAAKTITLPPANSGPINLVVPNTSAVKMEAISNLSKAILELSRAINGVNFTANISNNVINNAAASGISIRSSTDIDPKFEQNLYGR